MAAVFETSIITAGIVSTTPGLCFSVKMTTDVHFLQEMEMYSRTHQMQILLLPLGGHAHLAEPGCLCTKQAL